MWRSKRYSQGPPPTGTSTAAMPSSPEKSKGSVLQDPSSCWVKPKVNGEQQFAIRSFDAERLGKTVLLTSTGNVERERGGAGKAPARLEQLRGRQNSLRHVKDSTEMLRGRPTRGAGKDGVSDANAGMREGQHFTVANVGNNGKIYLRCLPTTSAPVLRSRDASLGKLVWDNFANLLCGPDQQSGRPTESLKCHHLPSPRPPRQRVSQAKRITEAPPTISCAMGNGRIHKIHARRRAIGVNNRRSG